MDKEDLGLSRVRSLRLLCRGVYYICGPPNYNNTMLLLNFFYTTPVLAYAQSGDDLFHSFVVLWEIECILILLT